MNDDIILPAVSGEFGRSATFTAAKGDPSGRFVVKVLSPGSGPVVSQDDIVGFDFVGQTWAGKTLANTYTSGSGATVEYLRTAPMLPMFTQALVGRRVGSRVLVVAPPAAGFGDAGDPRLGITCHDTVNLVVDITAATPTDATAQGTTRPEPTDLPHVIMGDKSPARFTITDTERNSRSAC